MFAFGDEGVVGGVGEELLGFGIFIHKDGQWIDKCWCDVDIAAGVEGAGATVLGLNLAEEIEPFNFAVDVIVIVEFGRVDFSHCLLSREATSKSMGLLSNW